MVFIPHIVVEFTHVEDPALRKLHFNLYEVDPQFSVEGLLDREIRVPGLCSPINPDKDEK